MTDRRKLSLCVQGDSFHRAVDRKARQLLETAHQLCKVRRRASRVTGLEQEGQADREPLFLEPYDYISTSVLRHPPGKETRPGGVVEQ
jgi:hypothetical protein